MIKERILKTFVIISLLVLFATLAFAQGTTSRITGSVTDSSGAPVTGTAGSIKRDGGSPV